MEMLNGILSNPGLWADWFTRLDETQKLVFLSQTGILLFLAVCLVLVVRKRMKVVTETPDDTAIRAELSQMIHDYLFERVHNKKTLPKTYKRWCRKLSKEFPDLWQPMTEKARKKKKQMETKLRSLISTWRLPIPNTSLLQWQRRTQALEATHMEEKPAKPNGTFRRKHG